LYSCVAFDKLAVLSIAGAVINPSFSAITTASSSDSFPACTEQIRNCAYYCDTPTFTSASSSAFFASSFAAWE
jgi:curli biogenesis system outer membrane secretion channel CsgG